MPCILGWNKPPGEAAEPGGGTSQPGLGWAGRMVGGKVQTEVHQGKRSRERHRPEQSHGKGGLGSCTEPRVPDGHTVPPPIGALGVVRSLAALVASEALEGSGVSCQRGSLISSVPMWLSPGEQQRCQERTEGEARTGCCRVNSGDAPETEAGGAAAQATPAGGGVGALTREPHQGHTSPEPPPP